jgi:hypothetical protein
MGCGASKTGPEASYEASEDEDRDSGGVVESIKEGYNGALNKLKPAVGVRPRTYSANDRAEKRRLLEEMRQEQEYFTMEAVEQFQFLISMPLEDREKWKEEFARVDASGDGLVSQDEAFDAMGDGHAIQREFLKR